jgi:hypothetical protein
VQGVDLVVAVVVVINTIDIVIIDDIDNGNVTELVTTLLPVRHVGC